ncbi:MAG: hypothetical protein WCV00_13095 [Verrucomicrobiia bacterium]
MELTQSDELGVATTNIRSAQAFEAVEAEALDVVAGHDAAVDDG